MSCDHFSSSIATALSSRRCPEMAEFMSAQIKQRALSRRAIAKGFFLFWTGCVSLWARKRSLSAQI